MSTLSRFDGKPLKSPDRRHSSHSAETNAIRAVNQAIKFNLAHLSTPGLPTEPLRLRLQNEQREPAELQVNRNVRRRLKLQHEAIMAFALLTDGCSSTLVKARPAALPPATPLSV